MPDSLRRWGLAEVVGAGVVSIKVVNCKAMQNRGVQ